MAKDDDDAWRAIVDNYGDRPEVGPEVDPDPPAPVVPPTAAAPDGPQAGWGDAFPDSDWNSDRFVPPPPPPVPTATPDRQAAWAGVFGAPAVLLVCLVFSIALPQLLAYALVASFVGGFVYLVLTMTREPRDPDDDGAVL